MWRYGHRVTRGHAAKPNIPLTSDLDIYRSAKLLIDQHGDAARIFAVMQAACQPDPLPERTKRPFRSP